MDTENSLLERNPLRLDGSPSNNQNRWFPFQKMSLSHALTAALAVPPLHGDGPNDLDLRSITDKQVLRTRRPIRQLALWPRPRSGGVATSRVLWQRNELFGHFWVRFWFGFPPTPKKNKESKPNQNQTKNQTIFRFNHCLRFNHCHRLQRSAKLMFEKPRHDLLLLGKWCAVMTPWAWGYLP